MDHLHRWDNAPLGRQYDGGDFFRDIYTSQGYRVLWCLCGAAGIERKDHSLDIVYDPADLTHRPTRLPDWSGLR